MLQTETTHYTDYENEPYRNLLAAVLQQAITDANLPLQGNLAQDCAREHVHSAVRFLFAPGGIDGYCSLLDIDPQFFRSCLLSNPGSANLQARHAFLKARGVLDAPFAPGMQPMPLKKTPRSGHRTTKSKTRKG